MGYIMGNINHDRNVLLRRAVKMKSTWKKRTMQTGIGGKWVQNEITSCF